jgi:hypothetical protein
MRWIFLVLYIVLFCLGGAYLESSGIMEKPSGFVLYGYLGGLGYALLSDRIIRH